MRKVVFRFPEICPDGFEHAVDRRSLSSSAPDRRFPYDAWTNKYAADITRPRVKWR